MPGHNWALARLNPPKPASCRGGCGREKPMRGAYSPRRHKSWDPETETFLCNSCSKLKPRIRLTCRQCGSVREVWPSSPKRRTGLCERCAGLIVTGPNLRRALLRKRYGLSSRDTSEITMEAQRMQMEHMVQRVGGRRALLQKANAARAGGLSEEGKRRSRVSHAISRTWTGKFVLCPWCGLLNHLRPERSDRPGFHVECYLAFRQSPKYREWLGSLGFPAPNAGQRRLLLRRFPRPPVKTGVAPRGTAEYLRWLLKRYLQGKSWRRIAGEERYGQATIRDGVDRITPLLPISWTALYSKETGKLLDNAIPTANLKFT
jgi:hypothetical protein